MMRTPLPLVSLVLWLVPTGVAAQSGTGVQSRLSADTLTAEFSGLPQAPGKTFRSRMIRTSEPGSGRDAGMMVHTTTTTTFDDDGSPSLLSQERITADARTFAFRSSWRRADLATTGARLMEATHTLDGPRIRQVQFARQGDERPDTSYGALARAGAPIASLQDLFHGAQLNSAWRGAFDVFTTATPFHQMLNVDSTTLTRATGAGARWVIRAHGDSAGRALMQLVATIDSATQDVLQLEWTRTDGTRTLITSSRFAKRAPDAPMTPVGSRESAVAGHYYLQGERELGSELMLTADGRFQFMLAYGALDESGEGQFRVTDGSVVLQSDGMPHDASVTLASSSGVATDSIVFIVVDSAGRILPNLTLDFRREGSNRFSAQTTRQGYTLNFVKGMPPSEVGIGVSIVKFRVGFPLSGTVHSTYRFLFDPGDLGRRRFEGERLRIEDGVLIMTRNGHPMRYVRR
ncbi:MAG: hypothetical protein H7099_05095 [Gemmatimonadaceae bacterium]|nr:hypothetical protein [Gemmatimonadaceae bacterium]